MANAAAGTVTDLFAAKTFPLPDGYSRALCANIAAWTYDALPAPVLHNVKALILDTLGVIGGAAQAPGIPELNARLSRWEKTGSATGLIGKRRYSPPTAAMANGAAAHALDFDDQHDPARVHTSAVVLPTLLATAEDLSAEGKPVSGKQLTTRLRRVSLHLGAYSDREIPDSSREEYPGFGSPGRGRNRLQSPPRPPGHPWRA